MIANTQIKDVAALIDLWASTPTGIQRGANLALSFDLAVPAATVRSMRRRNVIARWHWPRLLECAEVYADTEGCSPLFRHVSPHLLYLITRDPTQRLASTDARSQNPKQAILQH